MVFGPLRTPDSSLFIGQAEAFQRFFEGSGLGGYTPFKGAGIGLIVFGFQTAFGGAWDWALVIFQSAMSTLASWLVGGLVLRISGSRWAACLAMLAYGLTLMMSIDLLILRDSLFSSLLSICLVVLVSSALNKSGLSIKAAVLVGCIFPVCFSLREQMIYYCVFFVPLAAMSLRVRLLPWYRALALIVLLLLPSIGARAGLIQLNEAMTGQAVVSTNARTVMLQALLEVAEKQPGLFGGQSPLDRVAQETFSSYEYGEIKLINERMMEKGFSEREIAKLAIDKYSMHGRPFL